MKNILITGSDGFVGRNLRLALLQYPDIRVFEYNKQSGPDMLNGALEVVDTIIHLAGVNRPEREEEFFEVNVGLTEKLCSTLLAAKRSPKIIFSSSIQVLRDNPYGRSKLDAEAVVRQYSDQSGASCVIYRLKNVFGKWGRPEYNSVTATFCNNIAKGLPIKISDRSVIIDLMYVDTVTAAFVNEIGCGEGVTGCRIAESLPSHKITLGELADLVRSFHDHRTDLILPDFSGEFVRALYATYLSFVDNAELKYSLNIKRDARGSLAEFLKSASFGQLFISRTKPGIIRGNHFHHTKTEKFMVVSGSALIKMRNLNDNTLHEFPVDAENYSVIDIPPGCTHSIENTGTDELVTLFWASEIFNETHPDTFFLPVVEGK